MDGCTCQGGAAWGYYSVGFDVEGLDNKPQPRNPFPVIQADIVDFLWYADLTKYDVIHVSPPCQAKSETQRLQGNDHPWLVPAVREALIASGKPYVIENVVGSDLIDSIMLCGAMFGLRTYRHRLFESNIPLISPSHPEHVARQTKMGRPVQDGEFMHIVGNFHGADLGREIMKMPWATRDGLREAIPPAYTECIGRQLMDHVVEREGWTTSTSSAV